MGKWHLAVEEGRTASTGRGDGKTRMRQFNLSRGRGCCAESQQESHHSWYNDKSNISQGIRYWNSRRSSASPLTTSWTRQEHGGSPISPRGANGFDLGPQVLTQKLESYTPTYVSKPRACSFVLHDHIRIYYSEIVRHKRYI